MTSRRVAVTLIGSLAAVVFVVGGFFIWLSLSRSTSNASGLATVSQRLHDQGTNVKALQHRLAANGLPTAVPVPVSTTVIGEPGASGANGAPGASGATGARGRRGRPGATGATGVAGSAGTAGSDGQAGATGPMGPAGPTGPQGATGAAGKDGQDGKDGTDPTFTFSTTLYTWTCAPPDYHCSRVLNVLPTPSVTPTP